MSLASWADTLGAADIDAALPQAVLHSPDATAPGWEAQLARWARAQLAAGHADLHAHVREEADRILLQAALEHTGGHRGQAATLLGVGRNTVGRKLGPGRRRS